MEQPRKDLSVFWVSTDRVQPNPYQPRHHFTGAGLEDLAKSIRRYGVLQPLVVTKHDEIKDDGAMQTRYELIAGERRLRAARLAGLEEVPIVIRSGQEEEQMKLELAIIENLHREDLNPIDRARAFKQLAESFKLKHGEIAQRVGKSREYVSNSIRLLMLPEHMLSGIENKEISEGHARPLLMLSDKPEEQQNLFDEIRLRRISVRDAERLAGKIAVEKTRKNSIHTKAEEFEGIEKDLADTLGTRVHIQGNQEHGGKITIDFFSAEELGAIADKIKTMQGEENIVENTEEKPLEDEDQSMYSFKNFSL